MSVINESRENDPIIIISDFVACEYGTRFDWEYAREFKIGDIVYYVDYFRNMNNTQEYLQWCVKFRTEDGKIYSAIQLFFLCEYEWENIVNYIKEHNS